MRKPRTSSGTLLAIRWPKPPCSSGANGDAAQPVGVARPDPLRVEPVAQQGVDDLRDPQHRHEAGAPHPGCPRTGRAGRGGGCVTPSSLRGCRERATAITGRPVISEGPAAGPGSSATSPRTGRTARAARLPGIPMTSPSPATTAEPTLPPTRKRRVAMPRATPADVGVHRVADQRGEGGLAEPEGHGRQGDRDRHRARARRAGCRARRAASSGRRRRPRWPGSRSRRCGRGAAGRPAARASRRRRSARGAGRPATAPSRRAQHGRDADQQGEPRRRDRRRRERRAHHAPLRTTESGRKPCGRRRTRSATSGAPSSTISHRRRRWSARSSGTAPAAPAHRGDRHEHGAEMSSRAPLPPPASACQRNGMTITPRIGSAITARQPSDVLDDPAEQRAEAADRRGGAGQPAEREPAHRAVVPRAQGRDAERRHRRRAGALEEPGDRAARRTSGRGPPRSRRPSSG